MPKQSSTNRSRTARAGGAAVQVIAFLLLAALGVWLGAQYSGANLQHLAYTALEESDVIDHIPQSWRPAAPLPELGNQEGQVTFEQRSRELREELQDLRGAVERVRQGVQQQDPNTQQAPPANLTNAPADRRQASLAYWTRLRQITTEVNELLNNVESVLTPDTAASAFDIRRRAFEYGARSIEAVDCQQVDQQAVDAGYRIAKWYRTGADLYLQASNVWEGQGIGQASDQLERSLQSAKQQHAREAELVRAHTARTEEILMRRYAVEFPVLSI